MCDFLENYSYIYIYIYINIIYNIKVTFFCEKRLWEFFNYVQSKLAGISNVFTLKLT